VAGICVGEGIATANEDGVEEILISMDHGACFG